MLLLAAITNNTEWFKDYTSLAVASMYRYPLLRSGDDNRDLRTRKIFVEGKVCRPSLFADI